jgi:hypothetical protein
MTSTVTYLDNGFLFPLLQSGASAPSDTAPKDVNIGFNLASTTNITCYYSNTSLAETWPPHAVTSLTAMYKQILSNQCVRASAYICDSLERLDRSDDDYNEGIIERIASAIDLVGEPAYCSAFAEATLLREDRFVFERLLLAVASSRHKETEPYRLEMLRRYAESPDARTRYSAVRALGRMDSAAAKSLLREIASKADHSEVTQMAAAQLR